MENFVSECPVVDFVLQSHAKQVVKTKADHVISLGLI